MDRRLNMAMVAALVAAAGVETPFAFAVPPSSGAQNYRGDGGNRAYQRTARERRNRARNRKAHRA